MASARLALALLLAAALARPAHADISIGVAAPLTGVLSLEGEAAVNGAALAVEQLNARGGVLGQKLTVELVDDYCDGPQAVAAANKLVSAGVAVVVGHLCSGAAIPASEVYHKAGLLMLASAATNPKLTERGYDDVFRLCGRDDQQGAMAAAYIVTWLAERPIAVVHDGRTYGRGIAEEVQRQLHAHGVQEALFTQITPGQVDFGDLVAALIQARVGVLYYGGYSQEAGLLVRQAKERLPLLQVIVPDGVQNEDFAIIGGPAADGTVMTGFPDERQMSTAAEFLHAYKAAGYDAWGTAVNAYTAIQVWAEAAQAAGTTDSPQVEQALRRGSFDTPMGTLRFDAKGDIVGVPTFRWYVWQDGDYRPTDRERGY
jgi:branched-chain amino acid transport system substrate-binding protein